MSIRTGLRDPIDLEHLEQTLDTRGYQMIVERIAEMKQVKFRELRKRLSMTETDQARGFLDGIDACLAVPGILANEFKAKS